MYLNTSSVLGFFKVFLLNLLTYASLFFIFLWNLILSKIVFIPKYYLRSENIWNDGFLFDFLQKKTVDLWVRQYVIYTGFLFSERLMFEVVVRLYNDLLVWPFHNNWLYESSNTSTMLSTLIFLYFTLFMVISVVFTVFI